MGNQNKTDQLIKSKNGDKIHEISWWEQLM